MLASAAPIGGLARETLAYAARGASPLGGCAAIVAWALVPMACAAVAGAFVGVVQSGGLRVVGVVPKFERLSPVEGIKRMLSRETVTHAARACAAFVLAAAAVGSTMRAVLGAALGASGAPVIAAIAWSGAQHVAFTAAAIGLAFAFAEYGVARRAWLHKLRMSLQELKREMKERDGDPLLRGRRKAMHRAMARGSLKRVKDASFVVVNPTHVAVALAYSPPEIPIPTVLVRAVDEMALRVRELAGEHRVPIVENIPLARALYRDAEVDRQIPHAHYVAIAEIVAALLRSGALQEQR